MSDHFYSDLHDAVHMARHFGMEFFNPNLFGGEKMTKTELIELLGVFLDSGEYEYCDWQYPMYIHPENLGLLKPQIDDLIMHDAGEDDPYAVINYDPRFYCERHGVRAIVMRRGIHFIWPDKEAA